MRKLITLLMLMPFIAIGQQDTLKLMHYNLLNYGNVTSYCTNQNNNLQTKAAAMQEIISYSNPHILTVNEIGSSNFAQEHFLNSVLNTQGRSHYAMGNIVNASGGTIDNMLYYDSRFLELAAQDVISTSIRDIDVYKLYYRADDLANTADTAFLTCFVTHLKAGSSSSDKQLRSAMTAALMDYIDNNMSPGDFFLAGDFNVRSSSEQSYQNLVNFNNPALRFYDPISTPGSWNNNSSYSAVHTQSTHYSSNGCASGGGMDDRFDFILISQDIQNSSGHYSFEFGSYEAMGNDGQHFNDAINYGGNSSVPANVLNALYVMSDHLPVVMNLIVDQQATVSVETASLQAYIANPVGNTLRIRLHKGQQMKYIKVYSLDGQQLISVPAGSAEKNIDVSSLAAGIYVVEILGRNNTFVRQKIVKTN